MTCNTCNIPLRIRKILIDHQGPMGRARYRHESFCWYCEWKGTTGPGAELRTIIKEASCLTTLD